MSPVTVFYRTLLRSSAMFLGAAAIFLHPPSEWSSAAGTSSSSRLAATQSPTESAVDGLVGALKDSDAGVRRQAGIVQ